MRMSDASNSSGPIRVTITIPGINSNKLDFTYYSGVVNHFSNEQTMRISRVQMISSSVIATVEPTIFSMVAGGFMFRVFEVLWSFIRASRPPGPYQPT